MQGDFKIVSCPWCRYEVSVQPADYGRTVECPGCGRRLSAKNGREYRVPRIPEPEAEE